MRIAYQGEPGAFSEAAARQINRRRPAVPCRAFEDVFDAVKGGPAGYGVLPIENSIGGSIHRNFDLLLEHDLPIVGEVELPVVHHLLALPGTTMEQVRRIYSHPAGAGAVRPVPAHADGRRDHRDLRHRGQRQADRRRQDGRCGGDRVGARRRSVRADAAQVVDSGLRAQHHAVPRHRPPPAVRDAARQDDDRVHAGATSRARSSRR